MPAAPQNEHLDWSTLEGASERLRLVLQLDNCTRLLTALDLRIDLEICVWPAAKQAKKIKKFLKTCQTGLFYGYFSWNLDADQRKERKESLKNYIHVYIQTKTTAAGTSTSPTKDDEDPSSGSDSGSDASPSETREPVAARPKKGKQVQRATPFPASRQRRDSRASSLASIPSSPTSFNGMSDHDLPAPTDIEIDTQHHDSDVDTYAATGDIQDEEGPVAIFLATRCCPQMTMRHHFFISAGIQTFEHLVGMSQWPEGRLRDFIQRYHLCQSPLDEVAIMSGFQALKLSIDSEG